jgi:hypothetical protein
MQNVQNAKKAAIKIQRQSHMLLQLNIHLNILTRVISDFPKLQFFFLVFIRKLVKGSFSLGFASNLSTKNVMNEPVFLII